MMPLLRLPGACSARQGTREVQTRFKMVHLGSARGDRSQLVATLGQASLLISLLQPVTTGARGQKLNGPPPRSLSGKGASGPHRDARPAIDRSAVARQPDDYAS